MPRRSYRLASGCRALACVFALVACVALAASAGGSAGVARDATSSARWTPPRGVEVTQHRRLGGAGARARAALGLEAALRRRTARSSTSTRTGSSRADAAASTRTAATSTATHRAPCLRRRGARGADARCPRRRRRSSRAARSGGRACCRRARRRTSATRGSTLHGARAGVIAERRRSTPRSPSGGRSTASRSRGPGAKIRITFAGDGSVSQLRHAWRELAAGREGPPSSPPTRRRRRCAERYGRRRRRGRDHRRARLLRAAALAPRRADDLPALRVRRHAARRARTSSRSCCRQSRTRRGSSLHVETARDGTQSSSRTPTSTGGRPPYTYGWGSSHGPLDPVARTAGPDISYQPEGINADIHENVQVSVTDADGLDGRVRSPLRRRGQALGRHGADRRADGRARVAVRPRRGLGVLERRDSSSATGVVGIFNKGGSEAREKDFKDPRSAASTRPGSTRSTSPSTRATRTATAGSSTRSRTTRNCATRTGSGATATSSGS